MKKLLILTVFLLCAGFAGAWDAASRIPADARGAILLRPGRLFQADSPLALLQNSGEYRSILQLLEITGLRQNPAEPLPEILIVYFSAAEKMTLVSTSLTQEQIRDYLQKTFVDRGKGALVSSVANGIPMLEFTRFRGNDPARHRRYQIAFPGNGTVITGGHRDPLPIARLTTIPSRTLGQLFANASQDDCIFAATETPEDFQLELMGLSKNTRHAWGALAGGNGTLSLRGRVTARNPADLPLVHSQLEAMNNLLLVALFGLDESLFQRLKKTLQWRSESGDVILSGAIPADLVSAMNDYYRNHRAAVGNMLKNTVK